MGKIWNKYKHIAGGAVALGLATLVITSGYLQPSAKRSSVLSASTSTTFVSPVNDSKTNPNTEVNTTEPTNGTSTTKPGMTQPVKVTTPTVNTSPAKSDYDKTLDTLDILGKKYGIKIILKPTATSMPYATWSILGPDDKDNIVTMTTMLQSEWSKYPLDYVRNSKVHELYLVKDLFVDGQYRAAMPDPFIDSSVYYDVSSKYLTSMNGAYMKNVIHHEYDHLVEFNTYGSYSWNDTSWKACNTTGFTYGAGGAAAYSNPEFANTKHAVTGFVTGYGTYGIEEDKAEVFAELMTNYDGFRSLSTSDSNLACKFNLYQKYILVLSPSMDAAYLDARS